MKPEFDKNHMVFLVEDPDADVIETDEGDGQPTLDLPARYEVCSRCGGKGTHWHESLSNGITQEDRERDWDDESWSFLMSGGMDVQCSKCHGERVVPVPAVQSGRAYDLYIAWMEDEAAYQAMCAMERRMGA